MEKKKKEIIIKNNNCSISTENGSDNLEDFSRDNTGNFGVWCFCHLLWLKVSLWLYSPLKTLQTINLNQLWFGVYSPPHI